MHVRIKDVCKAYDICKTFNAWHIKTILEVYETHMKQVMKCI